jgi:hypothetical protein
MLTLAFSIYRSGTMDYSKWDAVADEVDEEDKREKEVQPKLL